MHQEQADVSSRLSLRDLLFWPVAFCSVALMALALLAPKLGQLRADQQSFVDNQITLVQIEHEAQHIRQLIDSLEHDPRFRAQVAATVFGQSRSPAGKQSLALPEELAYQASSHTAPLPTDTMWVATSQPKWLLEKLAPWERQSKVRTASLLSAGAMLVIAFLFLRSGQGTPSESSPGFWQLVKSRYHRED